MAYGQSNIVSQLDDTEPVTLAEAKNYLRVTNTQDDAKITSQIIAARAIAEAYINKDILPRSREQFIIKDETADGIIELYGGQTDTSEDGIEVTIDGVAATENEEWETIGLDNPQSIQILSSNREKIRITYNTAGLQTHASVKQGVLAILGELYEYGEVTNKWIWTILKPLKNPFF